MHSAPSVTYPVGRSHFTGAMGLAAVASGVAAALGSLQAGGHPLLAVGGVAIALASGCWACLRWLEVPSGELSWDGQGWSWSADGPATQSVASRELLVCLDLQTAILLRQPQGGYVSRWFWLERARSPLRWGALRRAVYSPAAREAIAGALPPPEKS